MYIGKEETEKGKGIKREEGGRAYIIGEKEREREGVRERERRGDGDRGGGGEMGFEREMGHRAQSEEATTVALPETFS